MKRGAGVSIRSDTIKMSDINAAVDISSLLRGFLLLSLLFVAFSFLAPAPAPVSPPMLPACLSVCLAAFLPTEK